MPPNHNARASSGAGGAGGRNSDDPPGAGRGGAAGVMEPPDLEQVARHEAGHAVMRWLVGWPATSLTARPDGSGLTVGTGRHVQVWDALRVTLAGPAAEAGYGVVPL